jgi:hypothetical protein
MLQRKGQRSRLCHFRFLAEQWAVSSVSDHTTAELGGKVVSDDKTSSRLMYLLESPCGLLRVTVVPHD